MPCELRMKLWAHDSDNAYEQNHTESFHTEKRVWKWTKNNAVTVDLHNGLDWELTVTP